MIATLEHNPRVVAGPGDPTAAVEIARLVGRAAQVGHWLLKLEGLATDHAALLSLAVGANGGRLWTGAAGAAAVLSIPADRVEPFLGAIAAGGCPHTLAETIRATLEAWQRTAFVLRCGGRTIELGRRTLVMGIVNVTPDSFSDGGQFLDPSAAIEHGRRLAEEGADVLDVGGESTRPGAQAINAAAECARVLPVVEALARDAGVPISIDTSKAIVAKRALDAGATLLNDVTALRGDPAMARVAADSGAPLVLMHMRGTPRTMQRDPHYGDLMSELVAFLRRSMAVAARAGVREEQIIVDPGIGFGKSVEHNFEILRRLAELRSLGRPILLGTSRKSLIGAVLGVPPHERLLGTAATVACGIANGAHIVRVHDVAAMRHVAQVTDAMRKGGEGVRDLF